LSKQQNIAIPEALLIKYLAGEASPEEALAIDEWIEQTPDNNRLLQQYLQLWSHASKDGDYLKPDLQRELGRLNIDTQHPAKRGKTILLKRTLFLRVAVAAVVLLTLGTALFVFLRPQEKAKINLIAISRPDGLLHDTLADHSSVVLTAGSRLEYPPSFDDADRMVQLQGEGYFSVAPDAAKPFIVHTGTLGVKVIGTAFNVNATIDSVTVQVDNGAVLFFDSNDSVIIKGGMQGVYYMDTHRFLVSNMESRNDYAYATKIFRFQDTRLESVIHALEKAYDVKIVLENEKLADCTITTAFIDMPLEYIMEVIAASLSIQYRMDRSTIYLQGNECN
jgi:ferric-dicitrate binding protein FerR (iron transport regulator)